MYITVKSLKKTLGKWIELTDLYIGLPILFIFLILFSLTPFKLFSIVFFTSGLFMMIPIQVSKKNRMYKILYLFFLFLIKKKEYIYTRNNERGMYE